MKRKILIIGIVVLVLAIGVTVWMHRDKPTTEIWELGKPLAKKSLKVGMIYTGDPENSEDGYSFEHYLGITRTQKLLALADDQIITVKNVPDANEASTQQAMRTCILAGANVIIAISFGNADSCAKMAEEYPHVVFSNISGYRYNPRNFTNAFGRMYQARYLAGIIAGKQTQTGKIGFVAAHGKDNAEVTNGIDGFALGVESVNPDAKIYVSVTRNWYDPMMETQATNALLQAGCDIITSHCNTAIPVEIAAKAGKFCIGYNTDAGQIAPTLTLTSAVWDWSVYYRQLLSSIIDGSFTSSPHLGNITDGLVTITPPLAEVNQETHALITEARERMQKNLSFPFVGELQTNDGKTVGVAEKKFSDAEILTQANWYYRNVIELDGLSADKK